MIHFSCKTTFNFKNFDKNFNLPDKGLCVIGDSNAAFSNLMIDIISGVSGIENGKVVYDGKDLSTLSEAELAYYRNNIVSVVSYNEIFEKTVKSTLLNYAKIQNKTITNEDMENVLDSVGLVDVNLDDKVSMLIPSQKELLSLAGALVKDSKVILVRRCITDITTDCKEFMGLLRKFSSDRLIVLSSTLGYNLEPYCDCIVISSNEIENKVDENNTFTPKKDKLSFRHVILFAKNIFFKHIFGSIFAFLTITLGLIFIAIHSCYMFYDYKAALQAVANNDNKKTANVYKKFEYRQEKYYIDGDDKVDLTDIYYDGTRESKLTHSGTDYLSKEDLIQLNHNNVNHKYYGCRNQNLTFDDNSKGPYYEKEITKIIEADLDFVNGLYEMLAGNYPTSKDEVLIPSYTANGLLWGLNQQEGDYSYIIGKEVNAKVGNTNSVLKISGVFKCDIDSDKYDILKDTNFNENYSNETAERKVEIFSLKFDFNSEKLDLYCFVGSGFFDSYPYKFETRGEKYKMKSLEKPMESWVYSYRFGYSCNCYRDSFIPFDSIDFENDEYTFYDLDGNVILNPSLEKDECYIPLFGKNVKEDSIEEYFVDVFSLQYFDGRNYKLKGYYSNPYIKKLNPIMQSETFLGCDFYDITAEYVTKYEETKEPYCDGAITITQFTRRQINNLKQRGKNYSYDFDEYWWVESEVKVENYAFLVWGIIFLLVGLSCIVYCFIIKKSNYIIFLRRYGLSKENLIKINLVIVSFILIVAFLLSLIGIYIAVGKLNIKYNYDNTVPFIHFGIFGYLLNIGIIASIFGIVYFISNLKKNQNDNLYYKNEAVESVHDYLKVVKESKDNKALNEISDDFYHKLD